MPRYLAVDISEMRLYDGIILEKVWSYGELSMNSLLRKCCAILLVCLVLCAEMNVTAAGSRGTGTTSNQTYEVLARSNMRAQPSLDGAWIMTVPQGAVVVGLDSDNGEFCRIIYEDVEGYIYSGCLRLITDLQVLEEEPQVLEESVIQPLEAAPSLTTTEEEAGMRMTGERLGLSGLTQSRLGSGESVRINVVSNANLRGAPSIEGRKILVVPKEASVVFLDEGENGYTHISYQGQSGYIYTRLLDFGELGLGDNSGIAQSVTIPEVQSAVETANNSNNTILSSQRGIANVNHIITQISVEVENVAASNMVEVQVMTASTVQAGSASAAGISTDNISYEISNRANMRMSPSVEGSWITTLPVGADVVKLGETTDGYTMVQYNGIVGYVLENCIADKVDVSRLGTDAVLFTVTAYCPCKICCGNYSPEVTGRESHTATGTVPQAGRTIAVDPRIIPYGTSVHIDGMGDYIAEDCGGSIQQNHIDIYFNSHEEAVAFGTKRLYVTINN